MKLFSAINPFYNASGILTAFAACSDVEYTQEFLYITLILCIFLNMLHCYYFQCLLYARIVIF